MTINDGYGNETDIDSYIRDNERLLRLKSAERANNPADWDDLLNEGRIVQWEVLAKRPDAPRAYVSAAMSMRLTEVAMRGKWFGMPSQQGKASVDPLRRSDRDSFDDPDSDIVVVAAETLDRVLLAYHYGEISQALNDLPERHREYVLLRFWGGYSNAEIAAQRGILGKEIERQWRVLIRPRLAGVLSHLAGAT